MPNSLGEAFGDKYGAFNFFHQRSVKSFFDKLGTFFEIFDEPWSGSSQMKVFAKFRLKFVGTSE